jgi:hypothetical protein
LQTNVVTHCQPWFWWAVFTKKKKKEKEKVIKSYLEKKKTYSGLSIELVALTVEDSQYLSKKKKTVEDFQSSGKLNLCNTVQLSKWSCVERYA